MARAALEPPLQLRRIVRDVARQLDVLFHGAPRAWLERLGPELPRRVRPVVVGQPHHDAILEDTREHIAIQEH